MVVVQSNDKTTSDAAFQNAIADTQRVLKSDPRAKSVVPPQAAMSISRDGHTAIVQAGAAADSNTMVRAADDLKTKLHRLRATACRSR